MAAIMRSSLLIASLCAMLALKGASGARMHPKALTTAPIPIPAVQQLGVKANECVLKSCCKSHCKASNWLDVCAWGGCSLCDFCFPGIKHNGTDARKIPNLQPGLIPSEGAWRGATHWTGLDAPSYDPRDFKNEFGVPLHLMRLFKGGAVPKDVRKDLPVRTLTASEVSFAEEGGIIWYGWQASTAKDGQGGWAEWFPAEGEDQCKSNREDMLQKHAFAVRSLAPALVMVAPGWEPDGHTGAPVGLVDETSHEYFGTYEQYIKQYEHAQKRFAEYGAYNAVWIVDFSHKATWDPATRPVIEKLTPQKIDWIFWNMFQIHSQKSYANFKKNQPDRTTPPVNAREALDGWLDVLKNVPQAQGKPWGLGAWGTNARRNDKAMNKYDTKGTLIEMDDRAAFLTDTRDWLSEHTDKVKASVYFDSLDCIIADSASPGVTTISSVDGTEQLNVIQNRGDLAHKFEIENFPASSELIPAFESLNKAEVFTMND